MVVALSVFVLVVALVMVVVVIVLVMVVVMASNPVKLGGTSEWKLQIGLQHSPAEPTIIECVVIDERGSEMVAN